jgi:hypothetical protein
MGPAIAAGEPVGRRQRDPVAAPACTGLLDLGDAADAQRRRFSRQRHLLQRRRVGRVRRVGHIQRGEVRRMVRIVWPQLVRSPHHGSSGASRAIATARPAISASVSGRASEDDTQAWR